VGEGLRLKSIEVDPPEVTLYGPASLVEGLDSVHTNAVSLAGFDGEMIRSVALNLNSSKSLQVDPKAVQVTITLESQSEERLVESVPVIVRGEGWTSVSAEARVAFSGPREAVRDLNVDDLFVVLTGPADLSLAVNSVSLSRSPDADYRYRILRPTGVNVIRVEPETFELVRRN